MHVRTDLDGEDVIALQVFLGRLGGAVRSACSPPSVTRVWDVVFQVEPTFDALIATSSLPFRLKRYKKRQKSANRFRQTRDLFGILRGCRMKASDRGAVVWR